MIKKTIILNGSLRKNWNTALILKEAQRGDAPRQYFDTWYQAKAKELTQSFSALNGRVELLPCCDTLQVKDYSRFNMAGFDEKHKKEMRAKQFPLDLENAFQMGTRLG